MIRSKFGRSVVVKSLFILILSIFFSKMSIMDGGIICFNVLDEVIILVVNLIL